MDSTNIKYRNADIKRWQMMDFVQGYEIHQSNNPSSDCFICKALVGEYPKSFLWNGWHDECKCFAMPIMEDFFSKSRSDDRVNRLKAALNGVTPPTKSQSLNGITYLPKKFIDYFLENRKQWNENNNFPQYVSDNIELIKLSYNHYYL